MPPVSSELHAQHVRTLYAGKLLPDQVAATLGAGEPLFPWATVACGATPRPLPRAASPLADVELMAHGRRHDLVDYLAYHRVAGFLVLADGRVMREE